tara:strand:- start:603 stop:962 length:360 start_codon:yes stop_codon:yes gene_type:complete
MNYYEEYQKQLMLEDVTKFFTSLGIRINPYGNLSMKKEYKESILRQVKFSRQYISTSLEKIKDIESRVNYGPAPRKSKYDPDRIAYHYRDIEKSKRKISWIKFHVRNLGWDITDEELEI